MKRRERECGGKIRYRDKREALRAAHSRTSSDFEPADFLRVYECFRCEGWHMTSKPVLRSDRDSLAVAGG